MIDLDVRALTDLSLAFIDSLKRRKGGILNVASIAAFMPGPGMAVYYASKAYVLSFSEALHRELKPKGVRVTVLCPGPVPTEFQARAGLAADAFPRILNKRYAAMCGGDFAALEAMLHDELLYTHSSGPTDTKATWLASLRSGKTKYKSAACSDRKVRLAGDTALVTGRAAIEAEINGQPRSLRLVFLNAWTKTPKGWKFIAWQSTPQPTT
jgi:NAD(P)-dependent dehydrogenase (short-subunit alcohol dehydrogenase family)